MFKRKVVILALCCSFVLSTATASVTLTIDQGAQTYTFTGSDMGDLTGNGATVSWVIAGGSGIVPGGGVAASNGVTVAGTNMSEIEAQFASDFAIGARHTNVGTDALSFTTTGLPISYAGQGFEAAFDALAPGTTAISPAYANGSGTGFGDLTLTVVPEPGTMVPTMALLGVGLLSRRRRRAAGAA